MTDTVDGQEYRRTRHVGCLFCGEDSQSRIIDVEFGMKAAIAHCPNCNFEYQSPQPSDNAIEDYVDWRWNKGEDKRVVSPWWQSKRANDNLDIVEKFLDPTMQILDYESGSGAFVKAAVSRNLDVVAYDPSEGARKAAKRIHGVEALSRMPRRHFDCITLWGALERNKHPLKLVEQLSGHLNVPGRVIISAANWEECIGDKWEFYRFENLYFFTPHSLEQLLVGMGFNNVRLLHEGREFIMTAEWRAI